MPGEQIIKDETFKNIEIPINALNNATPFKGIGLGDMLKEAINIGMQPSAEEKALDQAKELQKEQWAREDEIRKHVEEREDTAWTRSVKDMIRAGINPNLINAQPAQSGGGLTNATGVDYTMYEAEFNKELELLKQEIQNNFEGSENEKNRFMESLTRLITLGGLVAMKKK